MKFYICYANETRLQAQKIDREIRNEGYETCFIDRGDSELLIDPMVSIMQGIKDSSGFIILHSEDMNSSMLSQIEITYAKNLRTRIYLVKTGRVKIADAILFEIGHCPVINDRRMDVVAKKIIQMSKKEEI